MERVTPGIDTENSLNLSKRIRQCWKSGDFDDVCNFVTSDFFQFNFIKIREECFHWA